MKSFLVAGAIALATAVPVFAADMPVKAPPPAVSPVTEWGGFYFGAGAGWARQHPDPWTFPFAPGLATDPFPSASSFALGLHTGNNWQFGWLVLGTETNFIFTDLKSTTRCPNGNICQQQTQNIFLTGGRVGLAWHDWMLYGGGGYARTQIDTPVFLAANGAFSDGGGRWHNGWYGGGGLEWAWTKSIHFGIDYKHIVANTEQQPSLPIIRDDRMANDKIDMVMARVSFKLWSGSWGPFSQ